MNDSKLDDLIKECDEIASHFRMLLSQKRISEQLYLTKIEKFFDALDAYNTK